MKPISSFKNKFEFLSNFYQAPFVWAGEEWPTVEHAYQASKAISNKNYHSDSKIRTPAIAKHIGSWIPLRKDWEQVKVSIMTELVWEKFDQHPELRDKLLDTGSTELIEGNYWHDNFWGDCSCKKCREHKGKNMLGIILMEVREDLLTPALKLRQAVSSYIEAKTKMTKCMQQQFKQLCPRCNKYDKCVVYGSYVQAWMDLQDSYNRGVK